MGPALLMHSPRCRALPHAAAREQHGCPLAARHEPGTWGSGPTYPTSGPARLVGSLGFTRTPMHAHTHECEKRCHQLSWKEGHLALCPPQADEVRVLRVEAWH